MIRAKSRWTALALVAMLSTAACARAGTVTFSTVGTFTGGVGAGTNTYFDPNNGVSIEYLNILANNVTPTATVSFGTLDTSSTTAKNPVSVSSGFKLDIFQTSLTPGHVSFAATLSGTISMFNSTAVLQFSGPLSQTIGAYTYTINSGGTIIISLAPSGMLSPAEDDTPGIVHLAPPAVDSGLTTIWGTVSVVPEPPSIALLLLGSPALLAYRNRRRPRVAA